MKRVIYGVVLLLLVCILVPAVAHAQNPAPRPFTVKAQVTVTVNMVTTAVAGAGEGVASHLGKVTTAGSGLVTDPVGYFTMTAANGDILQFEWDRATNLATVTGGSGRFAAASGSFTIVAELAGQEVELPMLVQHFNWVASGTLLY